MIGSRADICGNSRTSLIPGTNTNTNPCFLKPRSLQKFRELCQKHIHEVW